MLMLPIVMPYVVHLCIGLILLPGLRLEPFYRWMALYLPCPG
jgi:hypothetical protein